MDKKYTILVVDDSELNLDILVGILSEEYEVSVALDGESALEITSFNLPDLVLLDIVLPGISGYDVCRELKKQESTKNIPIMFVTAKDETSDEKEGLELGAVDYITKPIVPEIVKVRIKNQLELKVARQKLEKNNEELKKMLQLREDLSHMIVHDIRNPLAAILGGCEILFMGELDSEVKEFIDDIHSQAKYANSFVDDLLMLAKADENELIIHLSDVNVPEAIKDISKNYKFIAQAKNIEIVTTLAVTDNFIAKLDLPLFKRVLDNLLSNALKFSPTNSKVVVEMQVLDENDESQKSFCIKICDSGPGVEKEYREKVFDKFEVVDLNEKGVRQTGLGLAFCKMVINAHKGNIYITENMPKGSVFVIEI